jgi:hypothetical protein
VSQRGDAVTGLARTVAARTFLRHVGVERKIGDLTEPAGFAELAA